MRPPKERSPVNLLVAARTDPRAFNTFYREQVDGLLRYFFTRTFDAQIAADLTAESFASAIEHLNSYDPSRGVPRQWLYGIANNELRAFWRHEKVATAARQRLEIPAEPIDQTTADRLADVDSTLDGQHMMDALRSLPDTMRIPVELRVLHQLPYDMIAAELGCTTGNARIRVFRGLKKLAEVTQ